LLAKLFVRVDGILAQDFFKEGFVVDHRLRVTVGLIWRSRALLNGLQIGLHKGVHCE